MLDDRWGTVTGVTGCARLPEFGSGVTVEGNGNAADPTGETKELVSVNQRMPAESPPGSLTLVGVVEVLAPHHGTIGHPCTEKVPLGPE